MSEHDYQMIAWAIAAVLYIADFIIRVCLLIYIPKNRKPTAAMSWLLLIFIIPLFGTILFFILGSTKLSRRRRRQQTQINQMLKRYTTELKRKGLVAKVGKPHDIQARLGEAFTSLAPTDRNRISIMSGYDNLIEELVEKVNQAREYVYVEFYILAMDDATEPFFQALEAAVQRGVIVRVLFDAWGSRKFPYFHAMMRRLTASGIAWRKILPVSFNPRKYNRIDLRNHRKIVVIDNTDAYMGSFNMIDKTYHRKDSISYIELVAHLQGPSVNDSAAVFASDWYLETGEFLHHFMKNPAPATKGDSIVQIVPSGSNYPYQNNLRLLNSLIQSARKSVIITNPYLVPDESLLGALVSAAQRGVRVSILNSEAMDQWMVGHAQRSYYEELIKAGAVISLYKKPQLVHEKFISVDNEVAIIGSSNLDIRSFELNLECVVVAYDAKTARYLTKHHDALLQHAHTIHLETWKQRSVWQAFLDSVARLTSALQ
ncbi:cardiolipin synthase [Candidatus Saccharibacteria bacterium]|nr:cardiolipin synthase [Candidatus Saccharibacteria bacterium]